MCACAAGWHHRARVRAKTRTFAANMARWCQPVKRAVSTRTYHLTNTRFTRHHGTVLHNVVSMDQAIASGYSRRQVYRLVAQGKWLRLREGVFLPTSNADAEELWRANLAALLLRHPDAAISHRAAAMLHAMEGVTERTVEATIAASAHRSPRGVHRTRYPDPAPVLVEGFATTSVERTLRDLAAVSSAAVVEQALESKLRGPDPRRPDQWNTALLTRLRESVDDGRSLPGTFRLRSVLARRSDTDRPTGSFPETLLIQMTRELGSTSCVNPPSKSPTGQA